MLLNNAPWTVAVLLTEAQALEALAFPHLLADLSDEFKRAPLREKHAMLAVTLHALGLTVNYAKEIPEAAPGQPSGPADVAPRPVFDWKAWHHEHDLGGEA